MSGMHRDVWPDTLTRIVIAGVRAGLPLRPGGLGSLVGNCGRGRNAPCVPLKGIDHEAGFKSSTVHHQREGCPMTHTRPDWKDLARELGVDVSPKRPSANTDQMAQRGLRPTNEQWINNQLERAKPRVDLTPPTPEALEARPKRMKWVLLFTAIGVVVAVVVL